MDLILENLETSAGTRRRALNYIVVGSGVSLVVPFTLCTLFVADIPNGPSSVMTAFYYWTYTAGAYAVLNMYTSAVTYGMLVGSTMVVSVISLMYGVYWSQLSGCTEVKESVEGYGCHDRDAMKALACFAVFLFMQQGLTSVLLVFWKDEYVAGGSAPKRYNPYELEPDNADIPHTDDPAADGGSSESIVYSADQQFAQPPPPSADL